jgi:L-type amino acid transporter 6
MEGILVTTPLLVPEPSIVAEDVLSIASTDVSSGENETVDREVPGRNLGVLDGIAIVLGLQIGSGIFSSPSLVVQKTGSEYVALLVWCIAGMMAWACAACYIELGTRLPFNGGPQEYLAYCFNDLFGFLASWACIFTVKPCSAAILALVISDYVCDALHLERGPLDFIRTLTAVGVIGLVTLINCAGNRQSNTVTKALLACKIFGVGFIIMMGLAVQVLPGSFLPPVSPGISSLSEPALGNYTDATLSAMWAYSGWETVCNRFLQFSTATDFALACICRRGIEKSKPQYRASDQHVHASCDPALYPR